MSQGLFGGLAVSLHRGYWANCVRSEDKALQENLELISADPDFQESSETDTSFHGLVAGLVFGAILWGLVVLAWFAL